MEEMWKQVYKFPNYEVSNLGRVRRIDTQKVMKPYRKNEKTAYRVILTKNKTQTTVYIHRLVAEEFLTNHKGYNFAGHINKDKSDNRLENIEWIKTRSHKISPGRRKGFRVTADTRKKLSELHKKPVTNGIKEYPSITDAAEDCGILFQAISNNLHGKTKKAGGYKWEYL